MIITYKVSMPGPYHIDNEIPCQDSYFIRDGKGTLKISAVADGLGSELYSDIGSEVAAKTAVDFCITHILPEMKFDEVKKIMNNAFVEAYKQVLQRAASDQNDPNEYDTTLCLAIYNGEHLYYGQSGDSGIIILLESGEFKKVTKQQRDEDGYVFPLCWGPEKWEFGEIQESISAVMLMTDGILEQMCPRLMEGGEIEINVPLASKFADRFECGMEEVEELESVAYEYLDKYPRHSIDDDKTIVVLINTARKPQKMEESYYEIPNWEELVERRERKIALHDKKEAERIQGDTVEKEESVENDSSVRSLEESIDNNIEKEMSDSENLDSDDGNKGEAREEKNITVKCSKEKTKAVIKKKGTYYEEFQAPTLTLLP